MTDARHLALPSGYSDLLAKFKNRVREAHIHVLRSVNTSSLGCTGPSGKRSWNARRRKLVGVGS